MARMAGGRGGNRGLRCQTAGRSDVAQGTCSLDGCDDPSYCRGWCRSHYARWLRHGDPLGGRVTPRPFPFNLIARLSIRPSGCVEFTGAGARYGFVSRDGVVVAAHVAMYEFIIGPVPHGKELHHRCENKKCVNLYHLLPVTRLEHEQEHRKTHCTNGHEFTPENAGVDGSGHRVCRTCGREKSRRYRQRKEARQ